MGHNLRSVSPQISQRGASYRSTDTARRARLGQSRKALYNICVFFSQIKKNKTDSKYELLRIT